MSLTKTWFRLAILLVIIFAIVSLPILPNQTKNLETKFSSKANVMFQAAPNLSLSTYLGGEGQDTLTLSTIDSSGNFYLVGNSTSTNFPLKAAFQDKSRGASELVVVKLSPSGELLYSTYIGGANEERPRQIKMDKAGNLYVLGATNSRNFPIQNAFQTTYKRISTEAFCITKLAPNGQVIYSTYLGRGGEVNDPFTFTVDDNGNVYVAGVTSSRKFPLLNPFQSLYGNREDFKDNDSDAFLLKIAPNGDGIFSTYLGGVGDEDILGLKLDVLGNIYIVGVTSSKSFPTLNAVQKKFGGASDGFVAKFSPRGEAIYSTFLGGRGFDDIRDFLVDNAGNITLVGKTGSQNFPIANAFQGVSGGFDDVFLTKLSTQGTFIYSTYLGGNGNELNSNLDLRLAIDSNNDILLSGTTFSSNFPLIGNSFQRAYGDAGDVFLAKINMVGIPTLSTYVGGKGLDTILQVKSDSAGNIYLLGETSSQDFPLLNPFQNNQIGDKTLSISKFTNSGSLIYSTYLGGRLGQEVTNFVIDNSGTVYLIGRTKSLDFPTRNAFQKDYGGGFGSFYDAFVTKINPSGGVIYSTYLGGSLDENEPTFGFSFVDGSGKVHLVGTTASPDLPTQNALQTSLSGSSDIYFASFDAQGQAITSTYLGGNGIEREASFIVANNGTIYLTGITGSTNFPTLNGPQRAFGGGNQDGFFLAIKP
ncbi:MAG: SBBP repeat-containing protein [Acidobacteria bacterium]|nr:SBBP repeat-containing protein [Acidobacteriota bacterium]